MKRLGILLVCAAVLALPSVAQLSGSWEMSLALLPSTLLEEAVLTLAYSAHGWTLSSVSTFDNTGFVQQEFRLKGSLGFFGISGVMAFNPAKVGPVTVRFPAGCVPQTASYTLNPPEYMWAWIKPEFTFGGLSLSAMFEHWLYPYVPEYARPTDCPLAEICWPCCESASYMRYTLVASLAPIAFTGRFEDCSTGITFKDFSITLTDVALCCGMSYNAELYFTRAGFRHVKVEGKNLLALPGGFSFDISVMFTVDGKMVEVVPRWQGLGAVCVQVFGDILWEDNVWSGFAIYGYRIACTFAECNTIEFVTVLDMTHIAEVEKVLGDIFQGDEFEVIRFGVCGLGCCGGYYHVNVDIYFAPPPTGGLFGISRARVQTEIPILANLTFTGSFSLPVAGTPSLSVGMMFGF